MSAIFKLWMVTLAACFLLTPYCGVNLVLSCWIVTIPVFLFLLLKKSQLLLLVSSAQRDLIKEKNYLRTAQELCIQFGIKSPELYFISQGYPSVVIKEKKKTYVLVSENINSKDQFNSMLMRQILNHQEARKIFNHIMSLGLRERLAVIIFKFASILVPKSWYQALRFVVGLFIFPLQNIDSLKSQGIVE